MAYTLRQTGAEIQAILDKAAAAPEMNAAEVTWAALVALRNAGGLTPGRDYRITDYETLFSPGYGTWLKSAGYRYDIIVRADGRSVLSETARAALHAGDAYFSGCRLEAWRLRYCLDNDAGRFSALACPTVRQRTLTVVREDGARAVYGYDYYNDDQGCDVWSLQSVVQEPSDGEWPMEVAWSTGDGNAVAVWDSETAHTVGALEGVSSVTETVQESGGKGVVYEMEDEWGNRAPWDFKNLLTYRTGMAVCAAALGDEGRFTGWLHTFALVGVTGNDGMGNVYAEVTADASLKGSWTRQWSRPGASSGGGGAVNTVYGRCKGNRIGSLYGMFEADALRTAFVSVAPVDGYAVDEMEGRNIPFISGERMQDNVLEACVKVTVLGDGRKNVVECCENVVLDSCTRSAVLGVNGMTVSRESNRIVGIVVSP